MKPARVLLSPDALFQDIDGEGVILDLKSSSYFGVDGVGVRLWQLLQTDPSLESAVNQLLVEYDTSREQLEQDISKFVDDLVEARIATVE